MDLAEDHPGVEDDAIDDQEPAEELQEEDPSDDEALETPTEVRELVGTLLELILAGQVEEPGPLSWKRFQSWRSGAGGRPTTRGGDTHSLTPAEESRIWRATMEALYGWIPREGQTEPPSELGNLTNRNRALASFNERMTRQAELRIVQESRPARPGETAGAGSQEGSARSTPRPRSTVRGGRVGSSGELRTEDEPAGAAAERDSRALRTATPQSVEQERQDSDTGFRGSSACRFVGRITISSIAKISRKYQTFEESYYCDQSVYDFYGA
jgi:hypothetical protein